MANHLFYGDNLDVLRAHVPDDSVDLIYLDPPFNSNANYNILFKSPAGLSSEAQIEAFEDTWHWNEAAAHAFDQVARSGHTKAFDLLAAMRSFLGENDMMAYLSMMAIRLIELHRVLKPTGSLYLHCDPTASHYLKLLLDGVFGKRNFRNEVVWCYRKWSVAQGQFVRNHDVLLFYGRSDGRQVFNTLYVPPSDGTMKRWKGHRQQAVFEDGVRKASSMAEATPGSPMPDWWEISILNPNAAERLGYPTQKPLTLLERIIAASSNPGDVVLDPFCGCGTAVHAAQRLGRRWVGIDVTHLAISLIEKRMRDAFPGIALTVEGTPKDIAAAEDLARRDKYQFQWWAVSMVDAMPFGGRKKGADGGVDGIIYFKPEGRQTAKALVSVKGGDHVGVPMIRDLHSAMERDRAPIGVFITKRNPTTPMTREAAAVGRFHSEAAGRSYQRLQILTLEDLFGGRRPDLPFVDPGAAFRRTSREALASQGRLL
ncbi:restriction endonuclease [Sphingomonas donggukensis]|uniref:Methyltransferase n=1 Tax=Sphingomonas donggukensis TaxID=2949093 RepID=A0ABY4U2I5_9SPHN|nr:DNA methyltransferase [Sphingomonas donggukensis]URW77001.1 restriction endonuclease [Sphingomonas donggukensis]